MTQAASRTRSSTALRRVEAYRKRFGAGHIYLACYATVPLALTPDLLYRLWANFQRDPQGEWLEIPWIAVSDLLLSNLCEEVGEELYEMEDGVREVLLKELRSLGETRLKEVAEFVLAYVEPQLNHPDLDTRDLAEVQQWRSLAYLEPEMAARAIAQRLARLDHGDKSEWLRMARVVEPLAEPLVAFRPLVDYTQGMAAFIRGRIPEAKAKLKQALGGDREVTVAGVQLPIPQALRWALQPPPPIVESKPSLVNFLLENSKWLGTGAALLIVMISGIFYWGRSQKKPENATAITSTATPSSPEPSPSGDPISPSATPSQSSPSPTTTPSPTPTNPGASPKSAPPSSPTASPAPSSKAPVSDTSKQKLATPKPNITNKTPVTPIASSPVSSPPIVTPSPSKQPANPPQQNNPPYIQSPQSQTAPQDNNRTQPTTKGTVVAQAPSGKVTAQVESNQSTIIIRDTAGNTLAELQNNGATVDDVKFSPDGAMMAVSSLDNTIKIWAIDGRMIREIKNSSRVTSFDFSSDSRSLIYSLDGKTDSVTMPLPAPNWSPSAL
jgi:hypothetical protein